MEKCINCEFWRNNQRDLNYLPDWGICEGDLQQEWEGPKLIKIHAKHHYHEDLVDETEGTIKPFSMLFCTNKDFGCVKWEKNIKD